MTHSLETCRIPLTKGAYAIVDKDDFEWLNQWKWYINNRGYALRSVRVATNKKRPLFMHRLLNKTPDGFDTDHINGNPLDNRRCNLRTVTRSQNLMNSQGQPNKSSKYRGVTRERKSGKWQAQLKYKGKNYYLGRHKSERSAALAYNTKAIELFGEYARLNDVK